MRLHPMNASTWTLMILAVATTAGCGGGGDGTDGGSLTIKFGSTCTPQRMTLYINNINSGPVSTQGSFGPYPLQGGLNTFTVQDGTTVVWGPIQVQGDVDNTNTLNCS
jgi:hypothetical protein